MGHRRCKKTVPIYRDNLCKPSTSIFLLYAVLIILYHMAETITPVTEQVAAFMSFHIPDPPAFKKIYSSVSFSSAPCNVYSLLIIHHATFFITANVSFC